MFLQRPYPYKDESLTGYLHRVAFQNGNVEQVKMRNVLELKQQEVDRNLYRKESLFMISAMTNQSLSRLETMTSNLFFEELQSEYFKSIMLSDKIQFCPLCIKEGAYHRKIWYISAIIMCLIHKVALKRSCTCRQPLSQKSLVQDRCGNCKEKLSTVESVEELNQHLIDNQMLLFELFTILGKKIHVAELELSMAQFIMLCRYSLLLFRNSQGSLKRDLTVANWGISVGHSVCEVIRMYEDFPNNYIRVLKEFFYSQRRRSRPIHDYENLFSNPTFDSIKQVYLEFAESHQNIEILRESKLLCQNSYPFISKAAASQILGMKNKDIVGLIELGILKEVEINFQSFLVRDEVTNMFKQCRGEIKPVFGRISIRDVLTKFRRKGVTAAWLVFLIMNKLLIPGSPEQCSSIMSITLDEEALKGCLEQFKSIYDHRMVNVNMQVGKSNVQFGLATVTGKGVVFNEKVYSNTQMIKNQWFELAQRTGSWTIPVLYNPEEVDHLVLFDMAGLEVASSVEEMPEIEPLVLECYYQALNSLKEKLKLLKG